MTVQPTWATDSWGTLDRESAAEIARRSKLIHDQARIAGFVEVRRHLLDAVHVGAGSTLVEVGVGPLPYLEVTRERLRPAGRWIASDSTEAFVHEARMLIDPNDKTTVDLRIGDARSLPVDSEIASAAIADKVLIHVSPMSQVVAELARVTRPGGWVGTCDADADGMLIQATDNDVTRRILRFNADQRPSPRAASRAAVEFRACGLVDVRRQGFLVVMDDASEPFVPTLLRHWALRAAEGLALDREEAEHWVGDVLSHADRSALLLAFPLIVTSGRKPATAANESV